MRKKDSLKIYRSKRDFERTPEPSGAEIQGAAAVKKLTAREKAKLPIFVIQKHAARRLHYDFRLEVDGVLKSWAVPKGPSLNPKDRRLAVPTEDHPMDYAGFEGTIPQGEYGGGSVIVWDRGFYLNITQKKGRILPMDEAIEKGHVMVWLEGEKLKGGFALAKIHPRPGEKEAWLLIKMTDPKASASRDIVKTKTKSVLTGRTIEEIGKNMSSPRKRGSSSR